MDSSVINALRSNGVSDEHIEHLKKRCSGKFFDIELCDKELVKLGYDPIFMSDLDDDDEFDDYGYDDYEKFSSKRHFDDEV